MLLKGTENGIVQKHQGFPSNSPHDFMKHTLDKSSKNASGFLEIELLFETTRIENVSKTTGFSCFSASSRVNIGGSRRGLREAVLGAFLRQKRNRLTAHVQEAS